MSDRKRIAIFVDDPDWHALELQRAFAERGARASWISLRDCRFVVEGESAMPVLPGFADRLPDAAFVRCISAGSFQQVTLRLSHLHALRHMEVPIYNDARAIECCVDKAMTSFLLGRAGIPTPPTWATEAPEAAQAVVDREIGAGHALVLKPLFGSQGRGLMLIDETTRLPEPAEVDGVYYLQRYVGSRATAWRDYRIMVAGGRTVAAMLREGVTWITNVRQGARCRAVDLPGDLGTLAVKAAAAVGADYAGVIKCKT